MKKIIFILIATLVLSIQGLAHAEDHESWDKKIEDNLLFQRINSWFIETKIDPIDDSKNVYVYLYPYPRSSDYSEARILFTCQNDLTYAYIIWDRPMFGDVFSDDVQSITHRLDKDKAITDNYWIVSNDPTITHPKVDITFIKSLFGHKKLIVRTKTINGKYLTMHFKINGVEEAIKPLQQCSDW